MIKYIGQFKVLIIICFKKNTSENIQAYGFFLEFAYFFSFYFPRVFGTGNVWNTKTFEFQLK